MPTPLPLILLAGVPRSGTSWLGEIVNSSPVVAYRFQPLFAYATTGQVDEKSTAEHYRIWCDALLRSTDPFLLQTEKRQHRDFPTFAKAPAEVLALKEVRYLYVLRSMLEQLPEAKLVGIIRHPCAVLASWFNAPRESPPGSNPVDDWRLASAKNADRRSEFYGFAKWCEAAAMFLSLAEQHPKRVRIVHYDRFVADPIPQAKALFHDLGLAWTAQTLDFVRCSRETQRADTYAVFKSQSIGAAWRERVPAPIIAEIECELRGTPLERFLQ